MSYHNQQHPVGAPPPQGTQFPILFSIFFLGIFVSCFLSFDVVVLQGILLRRVIHRKDILRRDILKLVILLPHKDTVKDIPHKAILHHNILKVLHHSILIKVLHRHNMVKLHIRRRKIRIQALWKDGSLTQICLFTL